VTPHGACPALPGQQVAGGSFALAGPHGELHRILALTGLLTWFDVDDTVEEAVSRTGTPRSPVLPAIPAGRDAAAASLPAGLTRGTRTRE
jgi:hypothetical protein